MLGQGDDLLDFCGGEEPTEALMSAFTLEPRKAPSYSPPSQPAQAGLAAHAERVVR
jgi:hypothetical protein